MSPPTTPVLVSLSTSSSSTPQQLLSLSSLRDWIKCSSVLFLVTCLWYALYAVVPSGLYLWCLKGLGSCNATAIILKIHLETQKVQDLLLFSFSLYITALIILIFPEAKGATDLIEGESQRALWKWGGHRGWGDSWVIAQKSHRL